MEAAEDRLLLTTLSNSMQSKYPIEDDGQYLDSYETEDQAQLVQESDLSLEDNVILALDMITSTNLQHTSLDLVPISYGDTILSTLINTYRSKLSESSPAEVPHSINTIAFNNNRFPSFDNTHLTEWKTSLKNQQERNLFLASSSSSCNEVLSDWSLDIGDYVEPEEPFHQEQQTINEGTNIVQHNSHFNWFYSTNEASAQFSLNKKQKQVLYLVACGLSGALSTQDKPLLIYCGGEGGTGKSRVIFAIRYLFNSMNISGKYIPSYLKYLVLTF